MSGCFFLKHGVYQSVCVSVNVGGNRYSVVETCNLAQIDKHPRHILWTFHT